MSRRKKTLSRAIVSCLSLKKIKSSGKGMRRGTCLLGDPLTGDPKLREKGMQREELASWGAPLGTTPAKRPSPQGRNAEQGVSPGPCQLSSHGEDKLIRETQGKGERAPLTQPKSCFPEPCYCVALLLSINDKRGVGVGVGGTCTHRNENPPTTT